MAMLQELAKKGAFTRRRSPSDSSGDELSITTTVESRPPIKFPEVDDPNIKGKERVTETHIVEPTMAESTLCAPSSSETTIQDEDQCYCDSDYEDYYDHFDYEEDYDEYDDGDDYFDLADQWEIKCLNQKRGYKPQRSTKDNKKDKISDHYVNGPRHFKEERDKLLLEEHFAQQKLNSHKHHPKPASTAYRPPTHNNSSSRSHSSAHTHASSSHPVLSSRQIQDLQNRELTPEDYELLLLLDQTVAPKTLAATTVRNFATRTLTETDSAITAHETCVICMCDYDVGDVIKTLPTCNHYFHGACLDTWLTKSSVKCPVDGLPINV